MMWTYLNIVLLNLILLIGFLQSEEQRVENKPAQGDLVVIVHSSIDVGNIKEMDSKKILNIYTLNEQTWSDGHRIYIADFKGDVSIRKSFYSILDIKQDAIKKIWLRAQFTGKSVPPSIVETEEEMIEKVIEKPGTIGYIQEAKLPANVKIIARFK